MASGRFDPLSSVAFDLRRGAIELQGVAGQVLIPADALLSLSQSADPEVAKDFARRLGTEIGRRLGERLGDASSASLELVLEQLAGELSLLGFGLLGFERWGQALVLTLRGSPFGAGGDGMLGFLLEGVLQRAFGRDAGVVRLMRDDAVARFLVTGRGTVELVQVWMSSGSSWSEALARLQRGGAS
ncbi:MAG: hypothetical protein M3020_09280 [Myxococcota bacterium]|jgi:hypothetical protein|nr:hypothetical protein [Myxococcota bacterium]